MSKRSLALLLGMTGDMGFAAGCLLPALRAGRERALLRLSPPAGGPEQHGRPSTRCEE